MKANTRALVKILFVLSIPFTVTAHAQVADFVVDQNSAYAGVAFELLGRYCKYKEAVDPFLKDAGTKGYKLSVSARTQRDGTRFINMEFESENKYLNFRKYYDHNNITLELPEPYCTLRTKGSDIPPERAPRH